MENINKLIEYQNKGFVFHGSPNPDILVFEPRQTNDTNKSNTFNIDKAVFASISFVGPIIFATTSVTNIPQRKLEGKKWSIGMIDEQEMFYAKIPISLKEYFIKNTGTVYVFDKKDFPLSEGEGSWQVKSKDPVIALDKIEVSFNDFEKSGGQIIWT